jgi:hypothetical protein
MNDIIQQARLMAAVQAYEAGDTDTAYRALGITIPSSIDPSQRALNETRTALGQQQLGYNTDMNPLKIEGQRGSNALQQQQYGYNSQMYPLNIEDKTLGIQSKQQLMEHRDAKLEGELLAKQLTNGKNTEDFIRDYAKNAAVTPVDVSGMDKKDIDALKAAQEMKGIALGNTVSSVLTQLGKPPTQSNIQAVVNAQLATDNLDLGITGPISRVNIGQVLTDHARGTGLGGVTPGDMDNYYKVADTGVNALSSPTKDNPMREALSILGTNALKAQGQGDLLNGTFAFLGDRNGPLDNTVMDALHNHARSGDKAYDVNLSMFYGHLPTILDTAAKASGLSGAKELVEKVQDSKDPDAMWSNIMKEAYDKYKPLYTQRGFNR